MKPPIQMKSSDSNKTPGSERPSVPQFCWATYIDKGEMREMWAIRGDFPREEVLPALLRIAKGVKNELLDHIMPGSGDKTWAELEELIGSDTSPESDEKGVRSDKVLTLATKPSDEG